MAKTKERKPVEDQIRSSRISEQHRSRSLRKRGPAVVIDHYAEMAAPLTKSEIGRRLSKKKEVVAEIIGKGDEAFQDKALNSQVQRTNADIAAIQLQHSEVMKLGNAQVEIIYKGEIDEDTRTQLTDHLEQAIKDAERNIAKRNAPSENDPADKPQKNLKWRFTRQDTMDREPCEDVYETQRKFGGREAWEAMGEVSMQQRIDAKLSDLTWIYSAYVSQVYNDYSKKMLGRGLSVALLPSQIEIVVEEIRDSAKYYGWRVARQALVEFSALVDKVYKTNDLNLFKFPYCQIECPTIYYINHTLHEMPGYYHQVRTMFTGKVDLDARISQFGQRAKTHELLALEAVFKAVSENDESVFKLDLSSKPKISLAKPKGAPGDFPFDLKLPIIGEAKNKKVYDEDEDDAEDDDATDHNPSVVSITSMTNVVGMLEMCVEAIWEIDNWVKQDDFYHTSGEYSTFARKINRAIIDWDNPPLTAKEQRARAREERNNEYLRKRGQTVVENKTPDEERIATETWLRLKSEFLPVIRGLLVHQHKVITTAARDAFSKASEEPAK